MPIVCFGETTNTKIDIMRSMAKECDKLHTVVDLFCGAGGLSLGFDSGLGYQHIFAADSWAPAVATYRDNFGDYISEQAIDERIDLPTASVIIGGPPCQGFTSAGRRKVHDERNSLVRVFGLLIAKYRPQAFVFENVEGFLTTGRGRFLLDLLTPVVAAGYQVHARKINAANYGVPQHRKRVIVVGGLGFDPGFPSPTHRAYGAPGAHLVANGKPPTPTLKEAIASLPKPTNHPPGSVDGHYVRELSATDLERAKMMSPGDTMRDLPEHLQHTSYRKRANRRVADGMPTERRGGPPSGMRRLRPDEPSKAITGAALRDFLHYSEHRSLTIRECARLQTYPDGFRFHGTPGEQIQQIGNGVPPKLASRIASTLASALVKNQCKASRNSGRLLSFRPTASGGRSPALNDVCELVAKQFDYSVADNNDQELFIWQR